jgi:type 1 glutamine amidotransferase
MYADVCRLLAASLNRTAGVEASVCPDLDWPSDESLLESADAIVYYSRPAGDILLSPKHRKTFDEMLARGVGLSAIHWATAAEVDVGPRYLDVLGGWFHTQFCGLKVDRRPLLTPTPGHAILRGVAAWDVRDEFYLNLKFHEKVVPVGSVNVDGMDQTVAWAFERSGGGRSFGTTLGHFHENFAIEPFRKMVVNGILWSADVEVPNEGADVRIEPGLWQLDESQRPADGK